jgi:hypothetical protein
VWFFSNKDISEGKKLKTKNKQKINAAARLCFLNYLAHRKGDPAIANQPRGCRRQHRDARTFYMICINQATRSSLSVLFPTAICLFFTWLMGFRSG